MAKIKKRRKKLQKRIDRWYGYQTFRNQHVAVRKAGAMGRGLFAVRRFSPGELIIEVRGQLHRQKDYASSLYAMELSRKWYLEPDIPAAFSNHSCNPNSELIRVGKYSLGIVAICNIEPGIEICYDYRWPALKTSPRCHCGAPNCRGWIVAEDEVGRMRKIAKRLRRR